MSAAAAAAAAAGGSIRLRLLFDYPPPAVVHCRMCWLLVDLNACRVVADLESTIRDKFGFSSRSLLSLFIDDCYLPHTERILVVRDNDSVRVKVDSLAQVNGDTSSPGTSSKNCRKRQRPIEEDGPGGNGVSLGCKQKKRKKGSKESLEGEAQQASADERSKKAKGKHKEKKRKKAEKNSPAAPPKPAASAKKPPTCVSQPVKTPKKPTAAPVKAHRVSSSDSSSSSSEEDEAPKKPPAPKATPRTPTSTPAAPKAKPAAKPAQKKKSPPTSSSSSETDSSSDEAPGVKIPAKNKPVTSTSPKSGIKDSSKSQQDSVLQSTNCAQKRAASTARSSGDQAAEPSNAVSEEEIELVIRQPTQQSGRGAGSRSPWRGSGWGRARREGPSGRGRGGGRGVAREHNGSFEFNHNGAKEPCYQTDSLTNVSTVFQNGAESAPKKDYSSMPLLAAPPQVGQKIAFKLLELTENYTPEISEYKEGKIVSFDPTTKQIELELLNTSQAHVEPGKFDLVYQNSDGSESVEYAVSRGAWVAERWDSLLEPRLVI